VADTLRQEHYVEDHVHVPVAMQQALAKRSKTAAPSDSAWPTTQPDCL
jgi:hypothetical protein